MNKTNPEQHISVTGPVNDPIINGYLMKCTCKLDISRENFKVSDRRDDDHGRD